MLNINNRCRERRCTGFICPIGWGRAARGTLCEGEECRNEDCCVPPPCKDRDEGDCDDLHPLDGHDCEWCSNDSTCLNISDTWKCGLELCPQNYGVIRNTKKCGDIHASSMYRDQNQKYCRERYSDENMHCDYVVSDLFCSNGTACIQRQS